LILSSKVAPRLSSCESGRGGGENDVNNWSGATLNGERGWNAV
jgi:hypothetical protein